MCKTSEGPWEHVRRIGDDPLKTLLARQARQAGVHWVGVQCIRVGRSVNFGILE